MARKFVRQYILSVTTDQGEQITITNPLTLDFNITRQNLASLNTATFTIYNLKERTRMSIFHDLYDLSNYLPVTFYAGYKYGSKETDTLLAQCFKGHVKQAYSVRDGPNYKTIIECWDGGTALNTSFVSQTTPAGNPLKQLLTDLVGSMKNIVGGVVSDAFNQTSQRATTIFGPPVDLANQLTGGNFYIDSQTAFAIKNNEAIQGTINYIDSSIGIVDVPKRTGTQIDVTTIFEPRYIPSQEVILKSTSIPVYNGQYKITGINHSGTISDAVSSELKTSLTLSGLTINNIIKTNISEYFKTISAAT
jgi:hypothetical protein